MVSNKLAVWFVQEIVIGFGFFTGFWMFVGFDPEALMVNSLLDAFKSLSGSMVSTLSFYYWIFGVVFTVVSIASAWFIGKWVGLLAVFFAFLGGLLITSVGVWFLLIGAFLGFVAPFTREGKQDYSGYY
jgi:hypothetical protein